MLTPARKVWVAMMGEEVVGWIGGAPAYDGNGWELHRWWSVRPDHAKA